MNKYLTNLFERLDKLHNEFKTEMNSFEKIKYENNKEYQRLYRLKKKEQLQDYAHQYYQENIDEFKKRSNEQYLRKKENEKQDIKAYKHQYYLENKEKYKERNKEYRENKKKSI
jgi:hypothetical protein